MADKNLLRNGSWTLKSCQIDGRGRRRKLTEQRKAIRRRKIHEEANIAAKTAT